MSRVLHHWKGSSRAVRIAVDRVPLEGDLTVPEGATGIVLFVHGSGSSRLSPRNRYVADVLNEAGLATLLFDLLTHKEEQADMKTAHLRLDIALLAQRVIGATAWLESADDVAQMNIGYFGASTGGAAALVAASLLKDKVKAVVSRGGRPDLAEEALGKVRAPTLLIVGQKDETVLQLNEMALKELSCHKQLAVLPQATHLFEEPGALEAVADLAADWFCTYIGERT